MPVYGGEAWQSSVGTVIQARFLFRFYRLKNESHSGEEKYQGMRN